MGTASVQKSSGTLYWYGMSGDSLVETNLQGANATEYFFFGGKRIARRGPAGELFYYVADHLGTSREMVRAGQTGACYDADFYPFGGERVITNACPQNYKFTGKERDSESGNDYFGARHYSSSQGRFMQPDPSPMGVAVADPQSWNLYSYVRNRPTRSVDVGGNWATDVHAEIVTFALQGYLSAGELQELVNRQYVMDSDQSDQSRHFMQNPGEHDASKASNDAWTFVADNMNTASANVGANGQLNSTGLDALGDAIHTVEDFTSPMHTDANFMPMEWHGGFWPPSKWGPGAAHVFGENSPERDWARIGYAIRLSMAALLQSGAGCEQGKRCLTAANFESEVRKNTEDYVRWHYYEDANHYHNNGNNAVEEDAARQCALGNPAACSD
jgi:RHS repeat-associated protein